MRLSPEKTALWNSDNPSARKEARRVFHAQAIRMMDDDPTATASLLPGRSVVLSSYAGVRVVAERSGDGLTFRIVRESRDGFTLLRSERWGAR